MNKTFDKSKMIISYLTLRKIIGIIGLTFPFILIIGSIITKQDIIFHKSLSHYYHTNMRDIFVGYICAVGLFLFSYRGHNDLDNIISNAACIFALGVAFLPTSNSTNPDSFETTIGNIHLCSASLFFLCTAYFSLFLFTKSRHTTPSKNKKKRNIIHYICGSSIIFSLVCIFIYMQWFEKDDIIIKQHNPIFWLESICLFAFGISWLTKGQAFLKDIDIKTLES